MRRLPIAVDAGLLLPGNGNPPLVAGDGAHGDTVAAIANAVCHVIVVRVRSLPRTCGCQEVLPVRRADLDMLRAAATGAHVRRRTSRCFGNVWERTTDVGAPRRRYSPHRRPAIAAVLAPVAAALFDVPVVPVVRFASRRLAEAAVADGGAVSVHRRVRFGRPDSRVDLAIGAGSERQIGRCVNITR